MIWGKTDEQRRMESDAKRDARRIDDMPKKVFLLAPRRLWNGQWAWMQTVWTCGVNNIYVLSLGIDRIYSNDENEIRRLWSVA